MDVLHGEEHALVLEADVEDRDHVGVREPGHGARLLGQAGAAGSVSVAVASAAWKWPA